MDAKGRSICKYEFRKLHDNIVIERFSHRECKAQGRSLKYEDVYPNSYKNIKEARRGIGEYIKIYNRERLHSALDYKTPDEIYYQGANNKSYNAREMLLEVA